MALEADGPALLDRALQRRVGFDTVHRVHCRNLGRAGSAAASRLLIVAADRACSHAERRFVRLLRESGIGGWAWHMTPERFVRDKRRQNAVVNGGWHVLRFSWHDLDGRPEEVVAEVRTALTQRR